MNERQKKIVQNLKKSDDIHCLNAAFEIEMMCAEIEHLRQIIDEKNKNIDKRLEEAISTMNDIKEMREKAKKDKRWDQHIEHCRNNGNGWV